MSSLDRDSSEDIGPSEAQRPHTGLTKPNDILGASGKFLSCPFKLGSRLDPGYYHDSNYSTPPLTHTHTHTPSLSVDYTHNSQTSEYLKFSYPIDEIFSRPK